MCGILGVKEFDNAPIQTEVLNRMLLRQQHRGPNFSSHWIDANVGLGHNRLSVIDLSSRAHQPMFNEDKTIAIVFNGEIYNFKEIRKELITKGYTFHSDSDTEVLLNGYIEYGTDIVNRISGMFAFCIYDKKNELLFLARDRFGKKPLFYYFDNQRFVFASELKTILEYPNLDKTVDYQSIDLFLSLQYIPPPFSIYTKIRQLKGSEYLIVKGNQISTHTYFDIQRDEKLSKIPYDEAKSLIKTQLEDSVRKRMVSDVPLGCFLSGGIDSSIIAAVLAKESTEKITTVSVGFDIEAYSEVNKARTIAKKYDTNHFEYILNLNEAKQNVENIISYYDQPFGDSSAIPTYYLSKVTRQNVTVALSGDGGDELFSGYQRYHLDKKVNAIQNVVPNFLLKGGFKLFNLIPPRKNVPIERNYLLGLKRLNQVISIDKRASILRWGSYFNYEQKQQLYKNYPYTEDKAVKYLSDIYDSRPDFQDVMQRTQYSDIFSYAQGDYLVKTDIASMQHALEVRCPFLDYELVNTVFSLNPTFFRNKMNGKHILKEAFAADLTDEVLYGPKQGFSIPMAEWFKGEWLDILQSYLESQNSFCAQIFNMDYIQKLISQHKKNQDDHSKRLYLLLVLEVWNKQITA